MGMVVVIGSPQAGSFNPDVVHEIILYERTSPQTEKELRV